MKHVLFLSFAIFSFTIQQAQQLQLRSSASVNQTYELTKTAFCSDGSDRASNGTPRFDGSMEEWFTLNKPKGKLKINLGSETIQEWVNPSFIGRRQAHKNFTSTCKMEFTKKSENEVAGMVITRDASNQFQLVSVLKNGKQFIQLRRIVVIDVESDTILAEQAITAKAIYLKAEALEQEYAFSYSLDGNHWTSIGGSQDGRFFGVGKGISRFTGTFIGMYASSNENESSNVALFDWFEYGGF